MAGHSKYKNIMYRKGAQDKKRSSLFSKLSREITVAAKMGLPDPDMNPRLRAAINAAKAQSMPKDNIQRSIDKAARGDAETYEEVRYEGFGPGGVSLIIEALTDNRNRTATNVRTAVSKNGGNLGASGSVSHAFDRVGLINYPVSAGSPEKVFEAALEAGAEDVSWSDDGHEIWTEIGSLHEVARALEPVLGEYEGAKLAWRPQTTIEVSEGDAATLIKLIDALDEDDDVQTVWGNYEVSDDVMEKLGLLCGHDYPRPRPVAVMHRLRADPRRGQPPDAPCQRPVQNRPRRAAAAPPRPPRGDARRADRRP